MDRIQLHGMELLRLRDCATSTRLGMRDGDQGFPNTMKILEAKKLVKRQGKGFVITELGLETLSQYRKELKII